MKRLVLTLALLKCLFVFGQINQVGGNADIARCHVFNKYGVKTFEENFYHFSSSCGYTLAEFDNDNGDHVDIKLTSGLVSVTAGAKTYELKRNAQKQPVFMGELKTYTLPAKENDIEVSKPGTYANAKFSSLGLIIKWDLENSAQLEIDTTKNQGLTGICSSDQQTLVDDWSIPGGCQSKAPIACDAANRAKSLAHCRQILREPHYQKCTKAVSSAMISNFLDICVQNHCHCKAANKNDCICFVVEAFSRTCSLITNIPVEWRKPNFCPKKCPAGQVYRDCGRRQMACGEPENKNAEAKCVEGCACPLQLLLHNVNQKCVPATECPCYYEGNYYNPGAAVKQDCKVCTCDHNNQWKCPPGICKEDADVIGDPHYTTFDKRTFDFMGKCTYYLVKGEDFVIKTDHYVYEHGKFVKNYKSAGPSYVKVLFVEYNGRVVSLKPGPTATIDDVPINQFPYVADGFTVSKPAASKIILELANHVEVHWDGYSWAKIRMPTTMRGRIEGLLGNFNRNPKDDLIIRNEGITQDANAFGHSWVVEGSCEDEYTDPVPHPCEASPAQKSIAEKACAPLKTRLFSTCKEFDSKISYEACVYDCCLVAAKEGAKCACFNLAEYAGKCSIQQWRKQVPVCEIPCPKGQVYNYCINPCESSCDYLNLNKDCGKGCIEGCGCSPGQTFNEENECVPIEKCKCKLNGKYFPAGFNYLKEANTKHTCVKGRWDSSKITPSQAATIIPLSDLQSRCKEKGNSDYTACKNPNPVTCKNMHKYQKKTFQNCNDGCECNQGFVLDTAADKCIKPESCPCFYNGQSYENNAVRRDFNKKCVCKNNDWECTTYQNRVDKCSIFGDTHIRNIDGKLVSFKSPCEYVLAKAIIDKKSFTITIESGQITVAYTGIDGKSKKVTLKKDGSNFKELGLTSDFKCSKIAELETVGIKFVWNHQGWLHVHFESQWRNKVEGICAHSNDPDKPLTDNDVRNIIDDSSVDQTCFDVSLYNPTKEIFEDNNAPVPTKCEVMKSKTFSPCNGELSIDNYYNKCLIVAREYIQNEDEKGVEEFYCQIFSTLAQECNDVGLPVNWRSKDQCPFECTEKDTVYSTCVSTCTCDTINKSENKMCKDASCVEGCVTTSCPKEKVYTNDTLTECVTIKECAQIECMRELESQPSHCTCVNGRLSCTTTTPKPPSKTDSQKDLSVIFTNTNQLLEKIKNPKVLVALADKDKQIVNTFVEHMKTLKKEILCYANLSDRSRCQCQNEEKEVCTPDDTEDHVQENDVRIQNKLDVVKLIESHLKCLLNTERGCACINGEKICKDDTSISRTLIYTYFTKSERHVVKYFYYLQKAKSELSCLTRVKKMPFGGCTCTNGQITCSETESGEKKDDDKQTKFLDRYSNDVQNHLQCYARLRLDAGRCWCEGARKICLEPEVPVPPNNKFEVIEHYLPTKVNPQQIIVDYEEDVKCAKTLSDDKCSCVNGKKVCPEPPPAPTPSPSQPKTESQEDLSKTFTRINAFLDQIRNPAILTRLPDKDKQIVQTFTEHLITLKKEILCYANLSDRSKCQCANEKREVCTPNDIKNHLKENDIRIQKKLDVLKLVESHLKCLLTVEKGCACLNGEKICKAVSPTSKPFVYSYFVDGDRYAVKYFSYLQKATSDLNCLENVKKMPYDGCTCNQGKITCSFDEEDGKKTTKDNVGKTETLNHYTDDVEQRLQCYARLKLDTGRCWCEGARKICLDEHTPIPANNKYEVIEHYLPTVIKPQQIEIGFEEDVGCVKTLTDDKCSCVDGKKVCPQVTPSTTPIPTTEKAPIPPSKTDSQRDLSIIFTNANELLEKIKNPKVLDALADKDKQIVNVFVEHMKTLKKEILCYANLSDRSRCRCQNEEKEVCTPDDTDHLQENDVRIQNKLDVLKLIESHFECLLNTERGCACVNGEKICKDDTLTSRTLIYTYFTKSERHVVKYFYYLQKAKSELTCLTRLKKMPFGGCTCTNGQITCSGTESGEKKDDDKKTKFLDRYSNDVQNHLQCYARLRLDAGRCWCEGARKICLEPEVPVPPNNKFEVIEHYLPTKVNPQQIIVDYEEDIECVKTLSDDKCSCVNGKKVCPEPPPDPTPSPSQPKTESQEDLSKTFTRINAFLDQIRNPAILTRLPDKDKQIVQTFTEHLITLKKEILCYANLSDRSKCQCANEKREVCTPNDIKNHLRENDIRIQKKLDVLKLVESHLKCLLTVEKGCACLNGEKICKAVSPTLKPFVYSYFVDGDRYAVKYFSYLQKATSDLNCLENVKKMPYDGCTCNQGKITCSFDEEDGKKTTKDNVGKTETLNHYTDDVEQRLQCYARLKLDTGRCWCEGARKICLDEHSPIPANNKYDVIEHYLPTVIKAQQIEIEFAEDLGCVKTLTDDKCSCVDGKKVCPQATPSTTPIPTTEKTPIITDNIELLTDIQIKLLSAYNNIQDQFDKFSETELIADTTQREVETVNAYKDYVLTFESEINCLLALHEFGKCICDGEQESCISENTKQHLHHNNIHMNNYLVIITNIETQLTCLLRKLLENPTCACLNGHLICPDVENMPTRTKIIYEGAVENDRLKVLSYYFLNYAAKELKCLSEEADSKTTTCLNGESVPIDEQDPDVVTKPNAENIATYTTYFKAIEAQLLCYSQLEDESCRCEGGKRICSEKKPVIPQNNRFEVVDKYIHSPINVNEIHSIFVSDIRCLQSLDNKSPLCVCEYGKKKCPEPIEVPPGGDEDEEDEVLHRSVTFLPNVITRIVCLTTKKSSECNDAGYNNVNVLSKDKLLLKVFGSYVNYIKAQLTCLKDKPVNCRCLKGTQSCPGKSSKKEETDEVKLYMKFLEYVDAQITCMLRVKRKSCFCVNGQEICDSKRRTYIIYPMLDNKVLTESNSDKLKAYIDLQLQCFKNIQDKSVPCTCKNGRQLCEKAPKVPNDDPQVIETKKEIDQDIIETNVINTKWQCFQKTRNVECFKDGRQGTVTTVELPTKDTKQIEVYVQFLDHARKQLECLRKTSNACTCSNFKAECVKTPGRAKKVQHKWEDQVKIYRYYVHYLNSQFKCLSTLNTESRLCACFGGKQVCRGTQFSNLFFPIIDIKGDSTYIEQQIKCIENIKDGAGTCVCKNGKAVCEQQGPVDRYTELRDRIPSEIEKIRAVGAKMHCLVEASDDYGCSLVLSLSSDTLTYKEVQKIVTPNDKQLLQTYIRYIPFIMTQMECFRDAPENCLCSHGRQYCSQESTDQGRRDTAANYIIASVHFVSYIESQIKCLVNLKPNEYCACGVDKDCYPTQPSYRLVQLISIDFPANDVKELQYTFVEGQIRCAAYLGDRSGKCTCVDGLEICTEPKLIPKPDPGQTTIEKCTVTKCPPNSQLVKKCPNCCPTCIQQSCVTTINGEKIIKSPGEKWSVGPCEQCRCLEDDEGFYASCRKKQCNDFQDADIEYKIIHSENECCPTLTPIGCKHEGKLFPLDSMIQRDSCETISCSRDLDGAVIKKVNKTICDEVCPEGFEYRPAPGECCGICEQIACLVNNELKFEGSKWSEIGGCLEFTCKKINGIFAVTKRRQC